MINVNDHFSGHLWDPWEHLGPKRRAMLEQSWAGTFREYVLPNLPIEKISTHYSENRGRPTKELFALVGALILQQMHDLTDEETIEQFSFNIQWHFALDILGVGDEETYICLKTLWNARQVIAENGLEEQLFKDITDKFIETFGIDVSKQRLDSVHIKSNMAKLGRIRIISATIKKFLVNLKRRLPALYKDLEQEIVERYKDDKSLSVFSLVKPSEAQKTLDQVAGDLYALCQHFKEVEEIKVMSSYGLMLRVLEEQCDLGDDCATPKPARKVPSDSLQNPSDPDASYDGHKGQGYQAQILETWSDDDDSNPLEVITHVEAEPAHNSDAHALIPAIEDTEARDIAPEKLLADTLYGSDDNLEEAAQHGVEVISPASGKESDATVTLGDFEIDETGAVVCCPEKHQPVETKKKKNKHTAIFELDTCDKCPRHSQCPSRRGKRNHYVHYTDKQMRLAKRRAKEKEDGFREVYRKRSGVEATMSFLNAKTGIKNLRVRGIRAVRYCIFLKALSANIYRLATA